MELYKSILIPKSVLKKLLINQLMSVLNINLTKMSKNIFIHNHLNMIRMDWINKVIQMNFWIRLQNLIQMKIN